MPCNNNNNNNKHSFIKLRMPTKAFLPLTNAACFITNQ